MTDNIVATLICPEDDGVSHINIYSNGRTALGRWMSNFAFSHFNHPLYGPFAGMESYWYWAATGRTHDELRRLYGISAKTVGAKLPRVNIDDLEFKQIILEGFLCKMLVTPEAMREMAATYLPFTHYYAFASKRNLEAKQTVVDQSGKHLWQLQAWTWIRFLLQSNGKAYLEDARAYALAHQMNWIVQLLEELREPFCTLAEELVQRSRFGDSEMSTEELADAYRGMVSNQLFRHTRNGAKE